MLYSILIEFFKLDATFWAEEEEEILIIPFMAVFGSHDTTTTAKMVIKIGFPE